MALICRDILRDLFRFRSDQNYEYGLWMPADEYRDDGHDRQSSSASSSKRHSTSSSSSSRHSVVVPDPQSSQFVTSWRTVAGNSTTVTTAQAGNIARHLGFAPSHSDIEAFKAERGDAVNQADVQKWCTTLGHVDTPEHLTAFFEHFDEKHTGFLSVQQIRNILKTYGEPLSDQEVDAALREYAPGSSMVDYRSLVTALLS